MVLSSAANAVVIKVTTEWLCLTELSSKAGQLHSRSRKLALGAHRLTFNASERKEMIDDSTMKAVNLNVAFGYSSQARHQLALFDLRRLQIHIAGVRQVRSASSASTS